MTNLLRARHNFLLERSERQRLLGWSDRYFFNLFVSRFQKRNHIKMGRTSGSGRASLSGASYPTRRVTRGDGVKRVKVLKSPPFEYHSFLYTRH